MARQFLLVLMSRMAHNFLVRMTRLNLPKFLAQMTFKENQNLLPVGDELHVYIFSCRERWAHKARQNFACGKPTHLLHNI